MGHPPRQWQRCTLAFALSDGRWEKALVKVKSLAEKHEARLAEHVGAKRPMSDGFAARFRLIEGGQVTS